VREIPKSFVVFFIGTVIIENRPRESDPFIFGEPRDHRALGSFERRIIERRDPELENELAGFAVLEIVIVSGIGLRQLFDPRLTAPDEGPVPFRRGRENVIVLGVNALKLEERVAA